MVTPTSLMLDRRCAFAMTNATRTAHPQGLQALAKLLQAGGTPKRIALVGTSKNAGKTTVLNALTSLLTSQGAVVGVASMGLDGEDTDAWLDFAKPKVLVERGTLLVTAERLIDRTAGALQLLGPVAGVQSSLGPLVVARARGPVGVQLCGVSHRAALAQAQAALLAAGATRLLVDGAYHRQAAAHPAVADATLVAIGAVLGAEPAALLHAALPTLLAMACPADPAAFDALDVTGALTDARLAALPLRAGQVLRVADPSRVLLSLAGHERLARSGAVLRCAQAVPLLGLCCNPFRPGEAPLDATTLPAALAVAARAAGLSRPVLDVVAGSSAGWSGEDA